MNFEPAAESPMFLELHRILCLLAVPGTLSKRTKELTTLSTIGGRSREDVILITELEEAAL